MTRDAGHKRSMAAGILLGVGMGGFVDGIVLHQILQWHNMVSHILPPDTMHRMSINMIWDGIFHASVWIITLIGVVLLRRAAHRGQAIPTFQAFGGQLILGWGLFNLVEGTINHHILELHYVREVPNYTAYNLTFLLVGGVLFVVIGWLLMRGGRWVSAAQATNPSHRAT